MEIHLDINDRNFRRGFAEYNKASRVAVRETLNIMAILSRKNAVRNVQDKFTLRNTFTVKQVRFQKVQNVRINDMFSQTGATQKGDYLEDQEGGGRRKQKRKATAIPQTSVRIGQSFAKPVSRDFYTKKIQKKMVKGKFNRKLRSRRVRGIAQMAIAWETKKFIRRANNIYQVVSFASTGKRVRVRLKRLYYIEKKQINLIPRPWLQPAIQKPARDGSNIYLHQLRKHWKNAKFV
jgi:hypothetical protein